MPPLGGGGSFPIIPGTSIYGRPPIPRPPRDPPKDIPLPETWPYPPSSRQVPLNFPAPAPGRRHHRQSVKFTPWILNLVSPTHKCADRNLFRELRPRPQPQGEEEESRGQARRRRSRAGSTRAASKGTVVLPVLPGPKRRFPFFDVTVMTLSNVEYTPGARYSELSWPLLRRQGFTRHVLHNDHTHDVTDRTERANERQYPDGADRPQVRLVLRPGGPPSRRGGSSTGISTSTSNRDADLGIDRPPRPGRNARGGPRFRTDTHIPSDQCGRLDKENSVIRHVALPSVDLLWCGYDTFMNPGVISVHMTGAGMVDLQAWSWGVESGIVGKGAGFRGDSSGSGGGMVVGWVARYAGAGPHDEPEPGDEEDLFRRIVQGGLATGEDLVREMGLDERETERERERRSETGRGSGRRR